MANLWDSNADELRSAREQQSIFSALYDYLNSQRSDLAGEGRRPVLGGLLSKEPVAGVDTLRYEGVMPMLAGLLEPLARGVDAPAAAYAGLIPQEDMVTEALGTAGSAITGGLGGAIPEGALGANVLRPRAQKLGSDYFDAPMENAGRAKDPAMFTEFSQTKHKIAPYEWQTTANDLNQWDVPTLIMPEKDQGKRMFLLAGDRTAGDTEITGLTNLQFRRPVVMRAGGAYMDSGDTWASHRSVMKPKQNVFDQYDPAEIKVGYTPMGERSGDFAKHQGELLSEALYSSPMPSEVVKTIDDRLLDIVSAARKSDHKKEVARIEKANAKRDAKGLDPLPIPELNLSDVPSVASEGFRAWLHDQSAEKIAKPFISMMDTSPMKALEGVPDVGEIRFAATSPDLVTAQAYSGGYRMSTPDVRRGLLASEHPSYDTKIARAPDAASETFGTNIPSYIFARDTALPRIAANMREAGFDPTRNSQEIRDYLLPKDQRVITMNPKTNQLMDQQWVDETSRFIELEKMLGKPYADEYARGLLLDYLRKN